jgi:phosphoglycerate dehydrogenase-like enzyme
VRIVLCYQLEPRHVRQIAATAPGHEIVDAGEERIAEELLDADIFCGHAKVPVPWDEVVRRGRLRWIQSSAAGLDHCLVPSVIDSDIEVSSASGLFADQVAEQTLALWLGLLRGLPGYFRAQQKKEFIRRPTGDLHRGTVGIVGFGGNGRRLAEVIAPMKTRILATDMFPDPKPDHVESLWHADRLKEMASLVDTLVLCIPLNSQTKGLIDRDLIAAMKPGSLIINVARGPVVDEEAIVDTLRVGHLAGYGTDVTAVEPLPPSSPLWDEPNVIITPHVGAQSASRYDDATNLICENLARYLAGKRPKNLVDKRLGYPTPEARGITDSWE